METLQTKTIIYDCNCPMCSLYTGLFLNIGVLGENGRVSFEQANEDMLEKLDLTRARHEIPLVDTKTGEVLYGLDGLCLIAASMFPRLAPLVSNKWFKKILKPVYQFISYNRRIIAGTPQSNSGFNCAPDFNLKWRLALIALGMSFTSMSIYLFGIISGISNLLLLFAMVGLYFVLLLTVNLLFNKNYEAKWDYIAHLAVLGIIESTFFISTALIAKWLMLPGLLFAGQGACRLFALWLHEKRVQNNYYSHYLNYAFGFGAVVLIVYLAVMLK
ncbi:MAG: hypothetical protein KIS94_09980 [Chitinophagales bacterium]|nr:hypothetical protein [Chitinophagales bacterium]